MTSIRHIAIVALFLAQGCAGRATAPVAAPVAPISREILVSSAPWTMPAAPAVSLDTPEERFAFAILATYPTGLSSAHERHAAKVLVAEAKSARIDPYLVLALIRVESSGKNAAVSSVGARGLMQIRPFVGRDLSRGTGIVWQGPMTLHDPAVNIRLGIKYLVELKRRFGSMELGLAAYNLGPTRLERRLSTPESARKLQNDYGAKILWFAERYRATAVPGRDLAPGIAQVTVDIAKIESVVGGKPRVAVALARAERKKKSPTRVDLNSASFSELLAAVPELTPKAAKALVEWREKHGGFQAIEDLDRVPGLNAALRARLRKDAIVGTTLASL